MTTAVSAAVLLIVALLPLVVLASELFGSETLSTLGSGPTWTLLAATVGQSLAITIVALAIGVPLGAVLGKTDVAGRNVALLVHAFPLFLPPLLIALGWSHVFGQRGWLGSDITSGLLFSRLGVVVTLGLVLSPIVTALTVLGLRGVDGVLEDAARTVANPRRVVTHILLPLVTPSVALSALIVFTLSLSEIGVPMFLRVRTYSAAVFSRLGGMHFAPGEAFALVLPLLAIGMALLFIEARFIGRRSFASLSVRAKSGVFPLGRHRIWVGTAVWITVVLGAMPIIALTARALGGLPELSQWTGSSVTNSLGVAASGATLITALGVLIGHRLARSRRGARALDAIAMLTFMTPAAVLGVGLVATWNRDATQWVYTTSAILVVALAARYSAIGIRTIASAMSPTSRHYEDAAAVLGGSFWQRLHQIVVPMHLRGIIATWLLAMVFCLRDLETLVSFYPPGGETLPIRIFTLEANGAEHVVAALAVAHVGLTATVLALGGALLWRRA